MMKNRSLRSWCTAGGWSHGLLGLVLAACGGSTGNDRDSGANKTYLHVEATSADGSALRYQWRVTSGSIDNRNAAQTVWTLPDGPGLHFAYVSVSDGRGGWAEQQYAVSSDALNTPAPQRAAISNLPPAVFDADGPTVRLRVVSDADLLFAAGAGGTAARRTVFMPDVRVRVTRQLTGEAVFVGVSDTGGEVNLPKLAAGEAYAVACSSADEGPLAACSSFTAGATSTRRNVLHVPPASQNLRLFGHIALADGAACGMQHELFSVQTAATATLQSADGTPLAKTVRVNRYGDYTLDAAVPVKGSLRLKVQCEGYSATVPVPASPDPSGYVSATPVELSHVVPSRRPQIIKMVGNGPDGNVRGRMISAQAGAASNAEPGANHFLVYKGKDTRLSSCKYYRSLGAVKDCDSQGNMVQPMAFDDWKRQNKLGPHAAGNTQVEADYINKMDLNLVRRMVATQVAADHIAFAVCNHPGPEGQTQKEIDAVMDTALAGERLVACVAMEWSVTAGVNGGRPFTKFFAFGPSGALLPTVNLDGRGEKNLPGACVACHGGTHYNGRFPEQGTPSPYLGSGFLPFDTGNYFFSTLADKTEAAQSEQIYRLNQLVRATEGGVNSAVTAVVDGWYAKGGFALDKGYVPPAWQAAESTRPGAARFYSEVVGSACRTCHAALGPNFNWDATVLTPDRVGAHVCGGGSDVSVNASMPNALVSRDRVAERVNADPTLAALMVSFLGCSTPLPDPVYPKR